MNDVMSEIRGDDLDPQMNNFRQMIVAGALGLKQAAAGRLITVSPVLGQLFWTDADAMSRTLEIAYAACQIQELRNLPSDAEPDEIYLRFQRLMQVITKFAQEALVELERLGLSGLALAIAGRGETSFHKLNDVRTAMEKRVEELEKHLDELLSEIKMREKTLVRLRNLGGEDAQPGKEAPGADGEAMP